MIDLNKLVRPSILGLKPYSSARDEFTGKEGVFLDANENPFGILNRYPDPHQKELKEKLATLKRVKAENIFIGNGSDEVIDLAFRVFCEPNKNKALAFSPTYGMYEVSAAINNVELLNTPLNQDFQLNIAEIESFLMDDELKIIFICSPNNPTGNLISQASIEFVLTNFKGVVIIDEAYIDFANANSMIQLIDKFPNLIVSQTFSKAWGLAGARVGVAYAQPEIIAFLNKVKPPYNVSELNQKAAIDALNNLEVFETNRKLILSERERVATELLIQKGVLTIYPSDANFLLIEVENPDFIYNELVKRQVIVRNRNKQIKGTLRISIGTPEENTRFLSSLNEIL